MKWTGKVERHNDDGMISYESVYEDYYVFVKPAVALSYNSGFLRISLNKGQSIIVDENGNETYEDKVNISLYIWPEVWSKYQMGIFIMDKQDMYQVYVDKNFSMQFDKDDDPEYYERVKGYFDEYKEEMLEMKRVAEEVFEFEF